LAFIIRIYHDARSSEWQIKQNIQDYDQTTKTHLKENKNK